jgi:hypothetical protein
MCCDASETYDSYLKRKNKYRNNNPLEKKYTEIQVQDYESDMNDLIYRLMKHSCKIGTCQHYYKEKLDPCRFHFPKELCSKSRIEYKRDKYKNGNFGPWQCIIIIKRINDEWISNFNREQIFIWRGNGDFSLLNNINKVELYVTKYTGKSELSSSVFNDVFETVINEAEPESSNTKQLVKKIMTKVMGLRDVTPNEAMHTLMGIELHNSNITVVKTSLQKSNLLKKTPNSIDIDESYLELYSNRKIHGNNDSNINKMNFSDFVTHFNNKLNDKKLVSRNNPINIVVRIYQYFSSNKSDPNYWLYCKYELLRYKPWFEKVENALDDKCLDDENGKKTIFKFN